MKKNTIVFGAITVAVLFMLTASSSALTETHAPIENEETIETDTEQEESPSPATVTLGCAFLVGALVIEEVTECKQIGNTNWYSIDITGKVPGSWQGFDDFGYGKFIIFIKPYKAGDRLRLKVKYIKNPPNLVVGERAGFGSFWTTLGIGISIEGLPHL